MQALATGLTACTAILSVQILATASEKWCPMHLAEEYHYFNFLKKNLCPVCAYNPWESFLMVLTFVKLLPPSTLEPAHWCTSIRIKLSVQLLFCMRGIQRLKTEKNVLKISALRPGMAKQAPCLPKPMHSSQWTATLLVQRKRLNQSAKRVNTHSYMLWLLCYQAIFGCLRTKQSFTNTRHGKEINITAVFTSDTHSMKAITQPHNPPQNAGASRREAWDMQDHCPPVQTRTRGQGKSFTLGICL